MQKMQELQNERVSQDDGQMDEPQSDIKTAIARWCPPYRLQTEQDIIEYITSKARKDGDCLTWVGSLCGDGAPKVNWRKKAHRAQRLLYQLSYQLFRPKWMVITRCGNKLCVNPQHLQQISRTDLNRKMIREGAMPVGLDRSFISALGRANKSRMGIAKAREVADLRASGMYLKDIGAIYGVAERTVSSALKRWEKMGLI